MKKRAKATLKVAIIVDPYGGGSRTGEEELEDHKRNLQRVFAKRDVKFETPAYMPENLSADLVVFDFGGMSLGNDLLASNSRTLARWMQDHPSSLVFVASTYTYRLGLQYELKEAGVVDDSVDYDPWDDNAKPPLPNLLVGHCDESGYGPRAEKEMAAWFSEPAPKPQRA